jgi:hypothetical protein
MEHRWSNTDENTKKSGKNCTSVMLSGTNRTQNDMGSSLDLRLDRRQRTAQVMAIPFCISKADDLEYDWPYEKGMVNKVNVCETEY